MKGSRKGAGEELGKKEAVKGKRVRILLKINGLEGMGLCGLGRHRDPASWRGKKRRHG